MMPHYELDIGEQAMYSIKIENPLSVKLICISLRSSFNPSIPFVGSKVTYLQTFEVLDVSTLRVNEFSEDNPQILSACLQLRF
jgi:hypothetical protein